MLRLVLVLFVLAMSLLVCELPEVAPTPAPAATATLTPVPTARPVPTPTATSQRVGIGAGLSDFEKTFGGLTFEYAPLRDGRDRWMSVDEDVIVEAIGPRQSLEKTTIIVTTDDVLVGALLVALFLEVVLPGWEDGLTWFSDHIEGSLDKKATTRVGSNMVELSASAETASFQLSVEAR